MRTRLVSMASTLLLLAGMGSSLLVAQEPEVRALWVDSFNLGLRSPAEVDALIGRAKAGNLNTIVAQVRRNAQSLYENSLEGWVENYTPPAGFDPLQYLIEKAHVEGMEVHAWANIGPVYSGHPGIPTAAWPCKVPCDPNHLFNQHGWGKPDEEYWLTRTHPLYRAGTHAAFPGERTTSGLWFLDLGHPTAAQHTLDVLLHLLRNYDVDGVHLDFIRYPEMPITFSPTRALSFSTGYNPVSLRRFNEAYGRPAGTLPDPWDASWSQWRRDQVSAFVRRLYLEIAFVKPQAKLSAALITFFRGPNTVEPRSFQQTEPYYRVFQDWHGWMREGILDLGMPMVYKRQDLASHRVQFDEWIEFTKTAQYGRHGTIGLGAFLNSLENTLVQIGAGRAPAANGALAKGFNFFSYNASNGTIPGVPARPRDEFFRALVEDGAYALEAPFPTAVPVVPMPWKTDPRQGHLLAQILDAAGRPADGAQVAIQKVGKGPRDEEIVQYADGNGYVGGIDLNPGAYQLVIELPGETDQRVTVPEPVVPGRVTRMTVNTSMRARGPMVRSERALGAHERIDHLSEASPLEEWHGREPLAEDVAAEQTAPPPQ